MAKKKKNSPESMAPLLHTMAQTPDAQKASRQLSELPDLKQHADAPKIQGYLLIKPLGRGAYAQVWEGVQLRTRKFVAIKVFTRKSGVYWFYLQREVDRLIRLDKHPNIVSLLDADLVGETPYYVMDLAQDGSLERFVEGDDPPDGRPEEDGVADWMEEVAHALNYVHAKQMVHCDLKPANLLLDEEGHVRLADFGNSRILSESGGTLGTLFFMAPEQAEALDPEKPPQPDSRWDIYALGSTIYSILAHHVPHAEITQKLEQAPTISERLRAYREAIHTQPVPDLFTLTKGRVDRDLSAIVAKCMAANPDNRYSSAAEVLKDLKARREGRPVSPLAHDKGYWLAKFILRYRVSVLIAAVSLAALLTALYSLSNRQTAQIQDTALNYVLRAREYLDKDDAASAVAYFAASNKLYPSVLARGNAVFYMPPVPGAFFAHDGPLVATAYSPDGRILLTAGGDTGARLWNPETGQALSRSLKVEGEVTVAAFSPDGSKLVLGSSSGKARIFDVATQQTVGRILTHGREITALAFSGDGRRILTAGTDGKAKIWDAATGTALPVVLEHDRPIVEASLNPAGDRALTLDKDGVAQLWDTGNGTVLGPPLHVDLKGAPAWYRPSAAFNPNSRGFLVTGWDGAVKFFDNHGKRLGHVLFLEGIGARAVYSPQGDRILASVIYGGTVGLAKVFKSVNHAPLKFSLKTEGKIAVLAFSPDGGKILTGGTDHVVRVWDAATGKPQGQEFWLGDVVTAAAFDPAGKTLAAGGKDGLACLWPLTQKAGDDEIELDWNGSGREHYRKLQNHALFSADGKKIVTYGLKTACLWDGTTGQALGKPYVSEGVILRAVFSPDGSKLLTCGLNHQARLWNIETGKTLVLNHPESVHGGAFSMDGKTVVTGGSDGRLRFWDTSTGLENGKAQPVGFPMDRVLLSPDGKRTAALGLHGAFGLYSAENVGAKALVEIQKGIKAADFSSDGRYVILVDGRAALLLDASSGKRLHTLDHGVGLVSILVSPDDTTAATLGSDGTIRLWNMETGLPIGNPLEHGGAVQEWAFSPKGEVLLAAYQDDGWELWDSRTGEPIGREMPLGTLAKAVAFDPDGRGFRVLGKSGSLVKVFTDWMDPKTDPNRLFLASQVSGRAQVNAQGSLEPVAADQWVRLWAQYRKEKQ